MREHPLLTWITDSSGITSVHRNSHNLSFNKSYLGHLIYKNGCPGYFVKGDETLHLSQDYARAIEGLTKAAMLLLTDDETTECHICPHPKHEGVCAWGMGCGCKGNL